MKWYIKNLITTDFFTYLDDDNELYLLEFNTKEAAGLFLMSCHLAKLPVVAEYKIGDLAVTREAPEKLYRVFNATGLYMDDNFELQEFKGVIK